MLYEYAIDPYCLRKWDTFIRLIEQFGIPYGRLISQFPKKWPKMVHEACCNFTFRERQIMADKLEMLRKNALIRSNRPYDISKNWKENALKQQRLKSFHAIISNQNQEGRDFVLVAGEIIAESALWKVPREVSVPRTGESLTVAIRPLLKISKRILFIDKLFDPATSRWQAVLRNFVYAATNDRKNAPDFEYHLQYDYKNPTQTEDFRKYCESSLSEVLLKGTKISLFRWKKKEKGEGLHARYVLTEKGGIRIDWGLDTGQKGETTDVSLMDESLWEKRWKEYQETSGTFDLVDKTTIAGKGETI